MTTPSQKSGNSVVKRRRGRPSGRSKKRSELIQGATVLFNSRGISAISIAEIAETLQLARASVYHYVEDRTDLVYQCYIKSCEQMSEDLLEAAAAETGLSKIQSFISRTMTPDRAPTAVLSEIHALNPSIAGVVNQAHSQNISSLRQFVKKGIEDGSIRQCDDEIVAQSLFGMLSWSQLLPEWSSTSKSAALRARTSSSLSDLLSHGLAIDRQEPFKFDISVERFRLAPEDVFDRVEAMNAKRERVLETASLLFNRSGIEATSLDKITTALGVTKGTLYHYLQDKTDLVVRCYERALALQDKFIELSRSEGKNGLEEARINAHLNIQAKAGPLAPLMPQPGFGSLPAHNQAQFRDIARRQNKIVGNFLRSGISAGIVRQCHASLVTHICAGAFGWIPKWNQANDTETVMKIADEICDIVFRGISA